MPSTEVDGIIEEMRAKLPAIVYRRWPKLKEVTGLNSQTLANLATKDKGPKPVIMYMGKAAYAKETLLAWIRAEMEPAVEADKHEN